MKTFNKILIDIKGKIGYLTINQPKALNALDSEVLQELNEALTEIQNNADIQVVIVTGAGEKAFVAGANIKEMSQKTPIEGMTFSELGNHVFSKLSNLKQPTIAAVNGFALGGGSELALACDIRIASETMKIGQPEVALGIIPGFGGTQRLSRLVGVAKAKELIFTGKNIKADEAEKIGLVNKVVASEELMAEAESLANQILKNAPFAVQQSKVVIDKGLELPLDHALTLEADTFGLCFATEDQTEGMTAFIEKRPSNFTGK
jgi:enoyl-CoA hydratase